MWKHHLLTRFRGSCLGAEISALWSHRQLGIRPMIFYELVGKDGAEMSPACRPGPGLQAGTCPHRRYCQKQVPVPDTALPALGTILSLVGFSVSLMVPPLRGGLGRLQPQIRKTWKHGLQNQIQLSRTQMSFIKKPDVFKLISVRDLSSVF